MSNYSSCIKILTDLIGFDKINDGARIALPDEVEVDTLVEFKEYLNSKLIDTSSNEMKMSENKELEDVETFWSCSYCTFDNEIDLTTCTMCGLPKNVCIFAYFLFRAFGYRKKKQQETYATCTSSQQENTKQTFFVPQIAEIAGNFGKKQNNDSTI